VTDAIKIEVEGLEEGKALKFLGKAFDSSQKKIAQFFEKAIQKAVNK